MLTDVIDDLLLSNPPASLIKVALDIMEARLVRPGRETRHFMFVAAGYLLMMTAKQPEHYSKVREWVIDRLVIMYNKILGSQRSTMPQRFGEDGVDKVSNILLFTNRTVLMAPSGPSLSDY